MYAKKNVFAKYSYVLRVKNFWDAPPVSDISTYSRRDECD